MKHWFGKFGSLSDTPMSMFLSLLTKWETKPIGKSYDGKEQWIMKQKGKKDINRYLI